MMDHMYTCAEPKKMKMNTSGTSCYALNCSTYQNAQTKAQGITFHKFPDKIKDKDRYDTWVRNCRRLCKPSPASRLCSQHFEPVVINRTLQRAQLREGAVPTIFTLPEHLQPKKTKRRLTKTSITALELVELPSLKTNIKAPKTLTLPSPQTNIKALEPLEPPSLQSPTEAPLLQEDHDYSDDNVRKRNLELEAENDRLRKDLRNAKVREERAKKDKLNIIQQLKDAKQLNEELELKMSSFVQSNV